MKHALALAPLALFTSPAFAHGGAHIHPHGMEYMFAVLAILTVIAVAVVARK